MRLRGFPACLIVAMLLWGGAVTGTPSPVAAQTPATVVTADAHGDVSEWDVRQGGGSSTALTATGSGRPGVSSAIASMSGTTTPASFALTDTPNAHTLTGFSPPAGPTAGGTRVTITVTAPAHTAGTVDISVTANGQTATIHGYTYLNNGNIAPQPGNHAPPGGGGGGGMPMAQPARHDDTGGSGGSGGNALQAITPTTAPQPERYQEMHPQRDRRPPCAILCLRRRLPRAPFFS